MQGALAAVRTNQSGGDRAAVERMLGVVPHRGDSLHLAACGQVAVGIRTRDEHVGRWLTERNGWVAAFVGRLDNESTLGRDLAGIGNRLPYSGPAELVLAAFDTWGSNSVARLRGAFAAVVSDGVRLWCFRDQIGFKPLFWRDGHDGTYVASEVKQILAGAALDPQPDVDAATRHFYGIPGAEDRAGLKGVKRFPRASIGLFTSDPGHRIERYWDPRALFETSTIGPLEVSEHLAHLLKQAIERVVSGNDAVALSGGIDSPTVAAFAAGRQWKGAERPLVALSAVYPNLPSVDESRYIEMTAQYLHLPLHTYVPSARPLDNVEYWAQLLDSPGTTLSLPELAELYSMANSQGAATVLTGELAEYVYSLESYTLAYLITHGRFGAVRSRLADARAHGSTWASVLREAAKTLAPGWVLSTRARIRTQPASVPWMDMKKVGDWAGWKPTPVPPARRRWAELQKLPLSGLYTPGLDSDELCAAVSGVTARRPLADVDLWEFMISLPAEIKYPGVTRKALIRNTMRGRLPDPLLERRDKTHFDDHGLDTADYPALQRWILGRPGLRVVGVDYEALAERLDARDLSVWELDWANNLARVHAFLGLW